MRKLEKIKTLYTLSLTEEEYKLVDDFEEPLPYRGRLEYADGTLGARIAGIQKKVMVGMLGRVTTRVTTVEGPFDVDYNNFTEYGPYMEYSVYSEHDTPELHALIEKTLQTYLREVRLSQDKIAV